MFQNLVKVRNAVEHEDVTTRPQKLRGIRRIHVVFLKVHRQDVGRSSDQIALSPTDENEDYYWLDLGYGPAKNWNPTLRGWVARDLISDQPKNEWIVLKPNVIETRAEAKKRLKGTKAAMKKTETGRGKASEDVYIL